MAFGLLVGHDVVFAVFCNSCKRRCNIYCGRSHTGIVHSFAVSVVDLEEPVLLGQHWRLGVGDDLDHLYEWHDGIIRGYGMMLVPLVVRGSIVLLAAALYRLWESVLAESHTSN